MESIRVISEEGLRVAAMREYYLMYGEGPREFKMATPKEKDISLMIDRWEGKRSDLVWEIVSYNIILDPLYYTTPHIVAMALAAYNYLLSEKSTHMQDLSRHNDATYFPMAITMEDICDEVESYIYNMVRESITEDVIREGFVTSDPDDMDDLLDERLDGPMSFCYETISMMVINAMYYLNIAVFSREDDCCEGYDDYTQTTFGAQTDLLGDGHQVDWRESSW